MTCNCRGRGWSERRQLVDLITQYKTAAMVDGCCTRKADRLCLCLNSGAINMDCRMPYNNGMVCD